ncbi:MAG: formylglycine-generating enzyme family protein [Bdellovibrionales bacterium]|nr:formylglycine-generating enzyme family protein [Bdellovibrionales bacterium]
MTISKDFEIQNTPVTQAQWYSLMGYNPSHFRFRKNCNESFRKIAHISLCPENPVENISWNDIQRFLQRINEKSTDYTYRLPTEAEWELAARAGKNGKYFFSNESEINTYVWNDENSFEQTHPVKSKPPSSLGIYCSLGNVWQWTQDWYQPDLVAKAVDPQGPESGLTKVIRGNSWTAPQKIIRIANRFRAPPGARFSNLGFRIVRELKTEATYFEK